MKKYWHIINLVITLISLTGIYVINSGLTPLKQVGEVENRNEFTNLTLPPGFIFSIWGIIYLGFLLFAILQLNGRFREESKFESSRALITVSIFFNLVWVTLVGFEMFITPYFLQWVMMVMALIIAFRVIRTPRSFHTRFEKTLFITFGLYAGWLTVAMIPYSTNILLSTGWSGTPLAPELWAIIIYCAASAIVYFTYRSLNYIWYVLPLIWALFGIAVKFSGTVTIAAGTLSAVGFVWMVYEGIRTSKVHKS